MDANTDQMNKCVVGKLLALVKYENEELTVYLDRICGLHGGINMEELYNPYIKIYVMPDDDKCTEHKTTCHRKTRNPVFNETFKVAYVFEALQINTVLVLLVYKEYK